jgi:hypothetical protein
MAPQARCPHRARHWFTVVGHVGLRSPVCVSCGAPNPRPLSEHDWAELMYYRDTVLGRPFRAPDLEEAIQAHREQETAPCPR